MHQQLIAFENIVGKTCNEGGRFIFVDARQSTKSNAVIFPNSRANSSDCSGPIGSMIELIQILLDINILPKFGADWSIFTDDRV